MEHKFKIGDIVRCVDKYHPSYNEVGIVSSLWSNEHGYGVECKNVETGDFKYSLWECRLELYTYTPPEIKTYGIVKFCKKYYK